jgi:glucose/arabinose dehydrogenase
VRRLTSRVVAIAAALVTVGAGLSGTAGARDDRQSVAGRGAGAQQLALTTTLLAFGLRRPTAITAPSDGSGRLLITEKPGRIRVYHPDTGLAADPLLDITDRVDESGNERGLLGLATAPDFASRPALYVAYTALPDGAVTLSRFRLDSAGQNPAPTDREEVLLTQEHAEFGNHNGGHLAFDPRGYLYLGIGDGGLAADPFASGQDLTTLLGKIVRIDVRRACRGRPYCIPWDNPFVNRRGVRPEIWAYGLRNPWRFSFDPMNGSQWIADVGQGAFEEINHRPGREGGVNYGWSCREGPALFNEDRCAPDGRYTDPVFSYQTSLEGCAVIGGVVYHGQRYADIARGVYVATDYCNMTAWAIRPQPDGTHDTQVIGMFPTQVTSFGVDAAGEIYVVNDLPGQLHSVGFTVAE